MLRLSQVQWGIKAKRCHDVQMTMGVACATLPTSSSFCMIFLTELQSLQELE